MKKAFSLAEVLVVLGIVGVVAAITMPSLIANHQKKQTVVQLRKVYSDLSNAVRLSEVDNGPIADWNYPSCDSYGYECIEPFLKQYYLPYFQGAKVAGKSELNRQGYFIFADQAKSHYGVDLSIITHYIILNNGTILSFFLNKSHGYMWLFADVNGMKGPNIIGRDIFVFDVLRSADKVNDDFSDKVKFWGRYINEGLLTTGNYGCYKGNTALYKNFYCGRLIELNNWEIPDGYPW